MKFIDISWPINVRMTAYKNKSVVEFENIKTFECDQVRESVIKLGTHTGTHVDAPAHFLEHGVGIDEVPLEATSGSCVVIDCLSVNDVIMPHHIDNVEIAFDDIVLFKTRNSHLGSNEQFESNFVFIDPLTAQYLVESKAKAVGIDYLGIERGNKDHDTHTIFMNNEVTIIEGLRLDHVNPGRYELICLPLRLVGLEAAPARAVLIER